MACKDILSLAGVKVAISPELPATNDQAGYEALTFTDIEEVTSVPAYGKTYSLITHNGLGRRSTCKKKGSFNMGSGNLELANWTADPGQALLRNAVHMDAANSFRITFQDGAVDYLPGLVMSSTRNGGTSEVIDSRSVTVEWVSEEISVVAP